MNRPANEPVVLTEIVRKTSGIEDWLRSSAGGGTTGALTLCILNLPRRHGFFQHRFDPWILLHELNDICRIEHEQLARAARNYRGRAFDAPQHGNFPEEIALPQRYRSMRQNHFDLARRDEIHAVAFIP